MYPPERCLEREEALRLWTVANTWFSNEVGKRGQIAEGQLADFGVLSRDYFAVPDEEIKNLTSVLTVVGGKVVFGEAEFKSLSPEMPPAMPDWSPVRVYGGYQAGSSHTSHFVAKVCNHLDTLSCHLPSGNPNNRGSDIAADWNLGCNCWAF